MTAVEATTLARLRGLLEVTRLVRDDDDPSTLLAAVARTVAESLGWGTVAINLYRPEWDDFLVTTVHGNEAAREVLLGDAQDWSVWAPKLRPRFLRRGAYVIRDGEFDWRADRAVAFIPKLKQRDDPAAWHAEDALFVPMAHSDGHLLGIISVDEPHSGRRPSDDELDVLVAVAAHAAFAVEEARRDALAARHRRALEHLFEVSSRLAEPTAAGSVLQLVADGIHDALGFRRVAIGVPGAGTDRLRAGAAAGWDADDPAIRSLLSLAEVEALCDPEFEVEGCYLLPTEEALTRVLHSSHTYSSILNGRGPRAWDRHWLIVPLRDRGGALIGFIWADEPQDRLLPSAESLQALRVFANHAAAAMQAGASPRAVPDGLRASG